MILSFLIDAVGSGLCLLIRLLLLGKAITLNYHIIIKNHFILEVDKV